MKRVEADKDWSLMCPHECPGLHELWGEEFEQLYERCGILCTFCVRVCISSCPNVTWVGMSMKDVPAAQLEHRSCGLPS